MGTTGTGRGSEPLGVLAIGVVTAPLLGVLPLMGWFFGALCHELGHTATSWFLGRPAIPRISPGGIALTTSEDPNLLFMVFVPLLLGAALWHSLEGLVRWLCLVPLAVLLVLGHAGAGESMLLLGGHFGELAIASVFLVRAWTGFWTASGAERVVHATCACYLIGSNVKLTGGLVTSEALRAWYRGPGAGACANDYVRLAESWGWSLEQVAATMTVPALVTIPLSIGLGLMLRREPPAARQWVTVGA